MTEETNELAERVKRLLVQELDLELSPGDLPDNEPLYSPRIRLDSLGYLGLLLSFEREFKVRLDPSDVATHSMKTVDNLVELVQVRVERDRKGGDLVTG